MPESIVSRPDATTHQLGRPGPRGRRGGALLRQRRGQQRRNGLYEPFPQAAVKKRAKRFVSRLAIPLRLDDKDLARGVFVTGRAAP